jgi:ferredoxin
MTIEIRVDRETCQGYGNCMLVAPDLFDLDGDGLAFPKTAGVDDAHLAEVRKAVYDCPTDSISFVELSAGPGEPAG